MKLIEIGFRGYKAYNGDDAPLQRLRLAPLTLLFGKNNSGKSAAVRLPRLLLGGMECNDDRVLPVEVRGLSYGSRFLDMVHGGDFFGRTSFQVLAEDQGNTLDFGVTLYSRDAFAADEPPRIWSYNMNAPKEISIADPTTSGRLQTKFKGLLPPDAYWDVWRKAASAALDAMVYLGPTREPVALVYANEQTTAIGLRGTAAPQLLRVHGRLAEGVGSWYARHMDGWRLSLRRDGDSFSLQVAKSGKLSANLAQCGEGLQQVLPVVAHQLWRQLVDSGPFLDVVEQPELHLHAAAQAPLADLFIDTALQGRGQVIIETHSEPLLLRTQRRVAEGKLRSDQVALYFVEMTEAGSQLRSVGLQPDGELDWWPSGVFEEDFSEVAAIRRAQKQRATPQGGR
jgi:hypothetical protein